MARHIVSAWIAVFVAVLQPTVFFASAYASPRALDEIQRARFDGALKSVPNRNALKLSLDPESLQRLQLNLTPSPTEPNLLPPLVPKYLAQDMQYFSQEGGDMQSAPVEKSTATKMTTIDRLTALYLNPNYPVAQGWDFSGDTTWRKVGRLGKNLGLLLMGVIAGIVVHEFSHFMVAKISGTSFEWPASGFDGPFVPLWRIAPETPVSSRIAVAVAGFVGSAVVSEAIMYIPQVPKDNLFILGLLLHATLNNLLYPITDAARNGYGDIDSLRKDNVNVTQLHIPLILYSLLTISRLVLLDKDFKSRFNPWAKPRSSGANVVLWQW